MKNLIIFLSFTISLVAGCSTDPVTLQSAGHIPRDRIYQPNYFGAANNASDATVVFLRDSGFLGSGCSHDMYINNIKVFSIRSNEQATIHLPATRYFFRLETGGGICPNIATSQESQLVPGARQIYRILLPSDGSLRLTRME